MLGKISKLSVLLLLISLISPGNALADEPLVYANNLEYLGAFRIPVGSFGGPIYYGFSYGGGVIAYNSDHNSLYMLSHIQTQLVGEVSIPTPKIPNSSTDLSNLNYSSVLQNLVDVREGHANQLGLDGAPITNANGVYIGGMLVYDNKLVGTSFTFYPGDTAYLSHWTSGLDLSVTGDFAGNYAVGSGSPQSSFFSGPMSKVPAPYQALLGGPALTGNGSLSVLSRTSFGPAAFSFDPGRLGIDTPVAATPLLYYDQLHQNLGSSNTNPNWNDVTKIAGMEMISASRSVLFFGYHGIGPRNYGQWSSNPIFADECRAPDTCITGPKGWPICADMNNCTTGRKGIPFDTSCSGSGSDGCYYDPSGMGAKGPHAYPYIYQVWAYDANDLAHVKNGDIISSDRSPNIYASCATGTVYQPWCVKPYAIWKLPFAVAPTDLFGGAAAFDEDNGRLFIVQPQGDRADQYNKMPLVHVFQVDMEASTASSYSINPIVMLLDGSITLLNNGGDNLVVTADSRTTTQTVSFNTKLSPGSSYNVTVSSQPTGQFCTVLNGEGTVDANNDISNIVVTCTDITTSDTTAPGSPSGLSVW